MGGDGKIVKDNWVNFGDKRYRVKEDGARYEDQWFNIMSSPALPSAKPVTNWYYAGADGSILKDGWHEVEGRYYYFTQGETHPESLSLIWMISGIMWMRMVQGWLQAGFLLTM